MTSSTSASASACAHSGARVRRASSEVEVWVSVMSASVAQLAPQLVDLVAESSGVLEAQVGGGFVHLFLQRLDEPPELRGCEIAELVAPPFVARSL
jgi:hypothetical protein